MTKIRMTEDIYSGRIGRSELHVSIERGGYVDTHTDARGVNVLSVPDMSGGATVRLTRPGFTGSVEVAMNTDSLRTLADTLNTVADYMDLGIELPVPGASGSTEDEPRRVVVKDEEDVDDEDDEEDEEEDEEDAEPLGLCSAHRSWGVHPRMRGCDDWHKHATRPEGLCEAKHHHAWPPHLHLESCIDWRAV
jgi:hypothetical protein